MKIGVLCLQGAFIEHINILHKLGIETFEIRQKKDIEKDFDGIILPGGESTTMGKLLKELDIFEPLVNKIKNNIPVFGTCAGLLLLAKKIDNDHRIHLATLDIVAKRNAYGRQLGSFNTIEKFNGKDIPMTFIRAPYIDKVGENVEILSVVDDKIVAVRENNQLATAFHPELTDCYEVHKYFINMVENNVNK
ncbi:pyridoxal 5'-phosphate synthase glutaminase subunit PdxT [[Clostridium] colinum]|uniref:pyridoxal 5'-phosphate synthase glutaminase subunit PdxT n=1 Tax=[Clostridium] colinum TaxID=36835 RepID=UPI002024D779|nr:pyridoxal 5'-phosphate synthase glutaminase subunit PdxT [[Clostridium] colinum]